jgi:hypothetical protein
MSEQEGFRPTGGRAKGGRCALCGAQAKRLFTPEVGVSGTRR